MADKETPKPSAAEQFIEKAKVAPPDATAVEPEDLKKVLTKEEKQKLIDSVLAMRDRKTVEHVGKVLKKARETHQEKMDDNEKQSLQEAETAIDEHGKTLGAAEVAKPVADLEAAPDPTKPTTPIENVKNLFGSVGTSAMGVLVRGWIGIQRLMIDFGLITGNKDEMKAKIDKIEELYGNWFGAAEMREQMSATLKAGNIEVRKGSQDGLAYNMLKEAYAAWILKKIPERKDAAGKVVPPTEAMINSVKQGSKIETFLREEAAKYKDKFGGPAEPGKKRITTIMGIANSEKPSVIGG